MEEFIDRFLTPDEVVHLIDGIRDNNIGNLMLFTTKSEHSKFHKG